MQSDLISRCRLKSSISREDGIVVGGYRYIRAAAVMAKIDAAPGLDAVPVVHGRWRQAKFTQAPLYICSECDSQAYTSNNYCPNCGAKMDSKEEQ